MRSISNSSLKELHIIGAGIIGQLTAERVNKNSQKRVCIKIYDKHRSINATTVSNIAPSSTPDELAAVLPGANELLALLAVSCVERTGINPMVANILESAEAKKFLDAVKKYSEKPATARQQDAQLILELGKRSMELWQALYESGDDTFKEILKTSNFHPCHEQTNGERMLHDGYRIDLIHRDNANQTALSMKKTYDELGYRNCSILSPDEVEKLDPSLIDFCRENSCFMSGVRQWKDDVVALWRPGGCIDANIFLPKLQAYLCSQMSEGDEVSERTPLIEYLYDHEIVGFSIKEKRINNLFVKSSAMNAENETTRKIPISGNVLFCHGENVSALEKMIIIDEDTKISANDDESESRNKMQIITPAYAAFAGASLKYAFLYLRYHQKN